MENEIVEIIRITEIEEEISVGLKLMCSSFDELKRTTRKEILSVVV